MATAVVLDRVPALSDMTERHLAAALRKIGSSASNGDKRFLRALADALDDPDSYWQLLLSRSSQGRPRDQEKRFELAMLYGPIVKAKLALGDKKESAIQSLMSDFGVSRSAVNRSLALYARMNKSTVPRISTMSW